MSAGELVARSFAARTAAHIAHLRTRSYSAHMALQGFYEGIVGLVDSYAEAYQGHFGMIETWPAIPVPGTDVDTTKVIEDLGKWCSEYREKCSKGRSDLANIIDEISALCAQSVYKLKNLK